MATYHAIAATGETMLKVLEQARPSPDFDSLRFELYQPSNFQSPLAEGISLYLYRVAPNVQRRHQSPRIDPVSGKRYRPSLGLDLSFLLTAGGKNATRQQDILAWAMRTLEDTPILPMGILNTYSTQRDTFGVNEAIELVLDSLSLQDLVSIWEIAKDKQQPSVGYTARMVLIDSVIEVIEADLVQTRRFDYTKVPS